LWRKAEYSDDCAMCSGGALMTKLKTTEELKPGTYVVWRRLPTQLNHDGKNTQPKFVKVYEIPAKPETSFLDAIDSGSIEMVQKFLKDDPKMIVSIDEYGETPLHRSIHCNSLDMIKTLLDAGADVHSQNLFTGETPLHKAALKGSIDVINLLIEKGASPNSRAFNGMTPLHSAIANEQEDAIEILTKHGAGWHFKAFGKKASQMLAESPNLISRARQRSESSSQE
jgi:ankyrin repeat protein